MRVICIKDGEWFSEATGVREWGPKYMEECDVTGDILDYYFLAGYEINPFTKKIAAFNKKHFVRTSDVSETEFEREYNKEHA